MALKVPALPRFPNGSTARLSAWGRFNGGSDILMTTVGHLIRHTDSCGRILRTRPYVQARASAAGFPQGLERSDGRRCTQRHRSAA